MDWKTFSVEIVKISIWPFFIFIFICFFRQQIQDLMKSISKLTIGNASAEFGKARLAKKIASKNDTQEKIPPRNVEQGIQQKETSELSREDILGIPDDDYEFMQKIAGNVKFMPTGKDEVYKYNSLVTHGYFCKLNGDEYKPTKTGTEIITALKSIYHS